MTPDPFHQELDTWRSVETPEGVELNLRVAGPAIRTGAWLIDALVRGAAYYGLGTLTLWMGGIGQGLMLISVFIGEWFYFVLFEIYRSGASPGKKACGLKVVNRDGTPIGWTASVMRNLMRFADFFPAAYAAGLVSCLFSPEFQRLGDRVAGTLVIYRDTKPEPIQKAEAEPIPPPIALSPEEQASILSFDERSLNWTRARKRELANLLEPLTGATDQTGLERLEGMATWVMRPQ